MSTQNKFTRTIALKDDDYWTVVDFLDGDITDIYEVPRGQLELWLESLPPPSHADTWPDWYLGEGEIHDSLALRAFSAAELDELREAMSGKAAELTKSIDEAEQAGQPLRADAMIEHRYTVHSIDRKLTPGTSKVEPEHLVSDAEANGRENGIASSPAREANAAEIKYPDISVQLTGENGNAFAIMGAVTRALKAHGCDEAEIDAYRDEAMAGDYNALLAATMRWVNVE